MKFKTHSILPRKGKNDRYKVPISFVWEGLRGLDHVQFQKTAKWNHGDPRGGRSTNGENCIRLIFDSALNPKRVLEGRECHCFQSRIRRAGWRWQDLSLRGDVKAV